jgi:hypothetical protein
VLTILIGFFGSMKKTKKMANLGIQVEAELEPYRVLNPREKRRSGDNLTFRPIAIFACLPIFPIARRDILRRVQGPPSAGKDNAQKKRPTWNSQTPQ